MENLSDEEFGSENNEKEAPLLVAQRYLNIFRQVHIFNKAKRDEFDDELLTLPTNITDFFKRMPGGRLLVEHIEKVKTERGISFVKTSREDFDEGAGKTPDTHVQSGAAVGGGTLVLDASFAETLAQSMAQAFKQNPSQNSINSVSPTVDFGNAFDIIAEEIRMSRTSLLDVLKETRSVTDSVIASQVSISRILESILSARTQDNSENSNLNDNIISSQASITKLLESIYTENNKRNQELSDYFNVEAKLDAFRTDIDTKVSSALDQMRGLLDNYAKSFQERPIVIEANDKQPKNIFQTERTVDDRVFEKPAKNIEIKESSPENEKNFVKKQPQNQIQSPNSVQSLNKEQNIQVSNPNSEAHKKKKKKKKHNTSIEGDNGSENLMHPQKNILSDTHDNNTQKLVKNIALTVPAVDAVIRNTEYKYNDDFKNVHPEQPPMFVSEEADEFSHNEDLNSIVDSDVDIELPTSEEEDDFDFTIPNDDTPLDEMPNLAKEEDDFDFALPNNDTPLDEMPNPTKEEDDFTLPNGDTPLDEIPNPAKEEDNFDFTLPNDDTPLDEMPNQTKEEDDFDFTLPNDDTPLDEMPNQTKEEDDFDFALPNNDTPLDEMPNPTNEEDDFTLPNGDTPLDEMPNPTKEEDDFTLPNGDTPLDEMPNPAEKENNFGFPLPEDVAHIGIEDEDLSDLDSLVGSDIDTSAPFLDKNNTETQITESPVTNTSSENFKSSDFDNATKNHETSSESITSTSDINSEDDLLDKEPLPDLDSLVGDNLEPINIAPQDISTTSDKDNDFSEFDIPTSNSSSVQSPDIKEETKPIYQPSTDEDNNTVLDKSNSLYSEELEKIRQALTSDNIDINSLDEPIALDDYNDDENVEEDTTEKQTLVGTSSPQAKNDTDWKWEYVDENGNQVPENTNSDSQNDEDWEWEYVDENGNEIPEGEEGKDWEWEYVEDNTQDANPKVNDNKK